MAVEAHTIAPTVITVTDSTELIAKLKKLTGRHRRLFLVSHSAGLSPKDGFLFFSKRDPTTKKEVSTDFKDIGSIAKEIQGNTQPGLRIDDISFRGCKIAKSDVGMVAFRDALGGHRVEGSSCSIVAQNFGLIFVTDETTGKLKPIHSPKDLKSSAESAAFDAEFTKAVADFKAINGRHEAAGCLLPLARGESAAAAIAKLKSQYFANGGDLVATWATQNDNDDGFFPGQSVCTKDLPVNTTDKCSLKRIEKAPTAPAPVPSPAPTPKSGTRQLGLTETIGDRNAKSGPAPELESAEQTDGPADVDVRTVNLTEGDGFSGSRRSKADVRALQLHLNEHGANIEVDGLFGPETAGAVKDAQEAAALPKSGTVDGSLAKLLSGPGAGSAATVIVGLSSGAGLKSRKAERRRVARLQQLLSDRGFKCSIDGKFGSETSKRLHGFQLTADLPPTDVVDESTASSLGSG
jgi:hypothetical protein